MKWQKAGKQSKYDWVASIDVKIKTGESLGDACERVSKEIGAKYWENPPGSVETYYYK